MMFSANSLWCVRRLGQFFCSSLFSLCVVLPLLSSCKIEGSQGSEDVRQDPDPSPDDPSPDDPNLTFCKFYADCDRDTYAPIGAAEIQVLCGTMPEPTLFCAAWTDIPPQGVDVDCNDSDANISPEGREICDAHDNDCDGELNEGLKTPFFMDCDLDGYAERGALETQGCLGKGDVQILDSNLGVLSCGTGRLGWTDVNPAFESDCNDANASRNPGQQEACDNQDNDCDGIVDEDIRSRKWLDCDGDGFGMEGARSEMVCLRGASQTPSVQNFRDECPDPVTANPQWTTNPPYEIDFEDIEGHRTVVNNVDCDDSNDEIRPDFEELCGDEIDNNCNGEVDEIAGGQRHTLYLDCDGDGVSIGEDNIFVFFYPQNAQFEAEACENANGEIVTGLVPKYQCPARSPNAQWISESPRESAGDPLGDCNDRDATRATLNHYPQYLDCDGDGAIRSECHYCTRCIECQSCLIEQEECLEGDNPEDCEDCAEDCELNAGPCTYCDSFRSAVAGGTQDRFFGTYECDGNDVTQGVVCGPIDFTPQRTQAARSACEVFRGFVGERFENAQLIPFIPPAGRLPCNPNSPADNPDNCYELPSIDCDDTNQNVSEWVTSRLFADCDGDGFMGAEGSIPTARSGEYCFRPAWGRWNQQGQPSAFPGPVPPQPEMTAQQACVQQREDDPRTYSAGPGYPDSHRAAWLYIPEALQEDLLDQDCYDFDQNAYPDNPPFQFQPWRDLMTRYDYNCNGLIDKPDEPYFEDDVLFIDPNTDLWRICSNVPNSRRCHLNADAFCERDECNAGAQCCAEEGARCIHPNFNANPGRDDSDRDDPNRLTPAAWFWPGYEQGQDSDSNCNLTAPGCGEVRKVFKECIQSFDCQTCNQCQACKRCEFNCDNPNDGELCNCGNVCEYNNDRSESICDSCEIYLEADRNGTEMDFTRNFECIVAGGQICNGIVMENIPVTCR